MIREAFDETNDVSSGLATYVALAEIASNNAKEIFTTTRAGIAHKAGLSVRKVSDVLKRLTGAKLLTITPNFLEGSEGKAKAPSTYTMLRSSGNSCTTSGNGCASLGTDGMQGALHINTRKREETCEENTEESAALRRRLAALFNRRAATRWTDKEQRAFKVLLPIDGDDLAVVERYYSAERQKPKHYCRRNLETLLNNFPGEVDRARQWEVDADRPDQQRAHSVLPHLKMVA